MSVLYMARVFRGPYHFSSIVRTETFKTIQMFSRVCMCVKHYEQSDKMVTDACSGFSVKKGKAIFYGKGIGGRGVGRGENNT